MQKSEPEVPDAESKEDLAWIAVYVLAILVIVFILEVILDVVK